MNRHQLLALVILMSTGCTVLAGARVSAGPALDTDGNLGAELALDVSWGASDGHATPTVAEYALLETVRFGAGLYPDENMVNTSVALEYVKVPLKLGLGFGLRAPLGRDEGEQVPISDALAFEFSAARLWHVSHEDNTVVNAGLEVHCGYRFLADYAMCSLGPSLSAATYKQLHFPR